MHMYIPKNLPLTHTSVPCIFSHMKSKGNDEVHDDVPELFLADPRCSPL